MTGAHDVIDLTSGLVESVQPASSRRRRRDDAETDFVDLVGSQPVRMGRAAAAAATTTAARAKAAGAAWDLPLNGGGAFAVDLTGIHDENMQPFPVSPPVKRRRRREAPAGDRDAPPRYPWRQDVQQVEIQARQLQVQQQQERRHERQLHRGTQREQQQEQAGQPALQQQLEEREQQAQQGPCSICFEDEGAMMHSFVVCGHRFCLPCLREYISGKVTDRVFPVLCPLPDCKKPISAAECGLVLTPEEQITLGKMEAEAAVGEGARLFCPNKRCSQLLIADDKRSDTAMECPYCNQQLCANCGVAWHEGMTCQQYQAQPGALRSKEDQAVLELAEQEGLRRCPGCGQMVERTQGCSHMHCHCGAVFCYSCGKSKKHGSSHYCTCKPAAEQWLHPPPAVAQQLGAQARAREQQLQAGLQGQAEARAQQFAQQRAELRRARRQRHPGQQGQQGHHPAQAAQPAAAARAGPAGAAAAAAAEAAMGAAAMAAALAQPPPPPAFAHMPDLAALARQMLPIQWWYA